MVNLYEIQHALEVLVENGIDIKGDIPAQVSRITEEAVAAMREEATRTQPTNERKEEVPCSEDEVKPSDIHVENEAKSEVEAIEAPKRVRPPFKPVYRKGGCKEDYNKFKPSVRMPDGRIIQEKNAIDTLIKVIQYAKYDRVAALEIEPKKDTPLLIKRGRAPKYAEATMGWWVLSDFYNYIKVQVINYIGEWLEPGMHATEVPK